MHPLGTVPLVAIARATVCVYKTRVSELLNVVVNSDGVACLVQLLFPFAPTNAVDTVCAVRRESVDVRKITPGQIAPLVHLAL